MVEFVVVVPFFFLVIFAGMEFAVLGTIRATSHNAAYEAARKIVVPGAKAAEGVDEAKRILSIVGVDTLTVTVTPPVVDDSTKSVTVNIDVPYASNAIFVPFFTGNVTLKSSVTLATERYDGIAAIP